MKTIVWLIFLVSAGLWTGFVALAAQMTEWLLTAMSSGQVADIATTAGQWPVPAWLALWVDPEWLKGMQLASVEFVQWLGQLLPAATGLMGWVTPLLWIGWVLGMLLLLVLAVLGHWLVGRIGSSSAQIRKQV
jgi:hypothetical protein